MPAELVQSLAILEMELIEEGAPAWVGQSFKDSVHVAADMQLKGCICARPSQLREWEWQLANRSGAFTLLNALPRSVLQVKRTGPEIDDPVMAPQDLRPEQPRHWLGTSEQIAVNQSF